MFPGRMARRPLPGGKRVGHTRWVMDAGTDGSTNRNERYFMNGTLARRPSWANEPEGGRGVPGWQAWRRAMAALAVLAALLGADVAGVAAQATPLPVASNVPAPDECRIPLPETIEFPADSMRPVAATPRPIATKPESPFSAPTGEPADVETIAAVTATVQEAVACRNAGDYARMLVFLTPNMLAELYGSPATVDPEVLRGIQEGPRPVPEERRLRLDAIDEIVMLPDGRAGAFVETSTPRREFRDFLFFALEPESGRWLIDGSVPLE